ncbi:hypothetical protein ACFL5U_03285 [Candidatus Margulisiibacteriota bacterium]
MTPNINKTVQHLMTYWLASRPGPRIVCPKTIGTINKIQNKNDMLAFATTRGLVPCHDGLSKSVGHLVKRRDDAFVLNLRVTADYVINRETGEPTEVEQPQLVLARPEQNVVPVGTLLVNFILPSSIDPASKAYIFSRFQQVMIKFSTLLGTYPAYCLTGIVTRTSDSNRSFRLFWSPPGNGLLSLIENILRNRLECDQLKAGLPNTLNQWEKKLSAITALLQGSIILDDVWPCEEQTTLVDMRGYPVH